VAFVWVSFRPDYDALKSSFSLLVNPFFYDPVPLQILKKISDSNDIHKFPSFIRFWTRDYDYLYVIGHTVQNPMPSHLIALVESNRFALYQIKKDSTVPPRASLDDYSTSFYRDQSPEQDPH
jgi:hypothetical protein